MPHPDMRVIDVPMTVGFAHRLMQLIDDCVATGFRRADDFAGPMACLVNSLPEDSQMRPGPMHWLNQPLETGRTSN